MSKCQKNKYFIGTCPGPRSENKEFNQSLSKLMAARDAQDSQIKAKPEIKTIVPFKGFQATDIDTILQG